MTNEPRADAAEPDGPPPLPPGEWLAPGYRVEAHLRRGEDLDVYDLWSETRGCRCIGKTTRPDRAAKRGLPARLRREGQLLLRLTHPNLVRAYEVISAPEVVVILETLPGETLSHLIDRPGRRLRVQDIAQLGLQLCSVTGYLHRNGVIHLDIKPSNIIAVHGLAKMLDLSLARPSGKLRHSTGTPGYLSPEQSMAGVVGPAADVWGIGITLHEVATGEPACDGGSESSTSHGDIAYCLPPPVSRDRRLPGPLATAIDQCLRFDPAERPTLAELANVLRGHAGA